MYSEIIKIIHNVFNFWMQKHFIGSEILLHSSFIETQMIWKLIWLLKWKRGMML